MNPSLPIPSMHGTEDTGDACCRALVALLGGKVSLPGSEGYESSLSSYFSRQESQIRPLCIVSPTTAEDVSTVVLSLSSAVASLSPGETTSTYHFAIRSGGHAGFHGAANIAGGVTLDLRALNSIEVSSDRSIVSVGVGATWGDIYSKLDPLGLSVAGGRAAQVGVGGLTTGGGISYFSPRYGWTCDTVSNFQVILANASIVNANADENPDLLFSLRGGSNNFGIVTRVDLRTFEQGPVWGGSVYNACSTVDEQLKAFSDFNSANAYDEHASLITSFGFASGQGSAFMNNIEYTKPEENPAVFEPLMKIPSLYSTMRIATMTEISKEQGSYAKDGLRQLSVVTTHGSTVPVLKATYQNWEKSLPAVENIPGIVWSISLEPLPPAIYARAPESNAFGLSNRSGSLVVALLTATWKDEADDAKVEEEARALFAAIESDAKKLNAYDPFIYLNYAAPWQKPIDSYGTESLQRLRKVKNDVDPNGVFTKLVPGGFKIPA